MDLLDDLRDGLGPIEILPDLRRDGVEAEHFLFLPVEQDRHEHQDSLRLCSRPKQELEQAHCLHPVLHRARGCCLLQRGPLWEVPLPVFPWKHPATPPGDGSPVERM